MDSITLGSLTALAAFIGFFHTLTGPDHYIPFIAMARAGRWTLPRTLVVTTLCGLAHVLSSVVLGFVGIALSVSVARLEWIEGVRGDLAAWMLLAFGLAYMVWGLRRAARGQTHTHMHAHADGVVHSHEHDHAREHLHVHAADCAPGANCARGDAPTRGALTPWVLFTIFAFGPCEPLIPILMVPALRLSLASVWIVAAAFAVATLATMLAVVSAGTLGAARLPLRPLERYSHAIAGGALAACGGMMVMGF